MQPITRPKPVPDFYFRTHTHLGLKIIRPKPDPLGLGRAMLPSLSDGTSLFKRLTNSVSLFHHWSYFLPSIKSDALGQPSS